MGWLLISLPDIVSAQAEHHNWLLDGNIWIDFSTGDPIVQEPLEFSTIEASAAVSDSLGNLLFYTNGVEIYNRFGEVMSQEIPFSDTTYYKSQTQGVLILPAVGQPEKYRIIGIGRYATVDMSLNGGLGGMETLPAWRHFEGDYGVDSIGVGEKSTAVRHANGRDWWILQLRLIRDYESDRYDSVLLSFLYDNRGVHLVNEKRFNLYNSGFSSVYGEMTASLSGDKIAMALTGSLVVYNFDRCAGQLTDELIYIDSLGPVYGCAFSPSGSKLYFNLSNGIISGNNVLYQLNLEKDQFGSFPLTEIYRREIFNQFANGQLELGPDGKIYMSAGCKVYCESVALPNTTLSVIDKPNLSGLACDFVPFSFSLEGRKTWLALPNNVNYELKALEGSECDTIIKATGLSLITEPGATWQVRPTVSNGIYQFFGPYQATLEVFDLIGRVIWSCSYNCTQVDLTTSPVGVYNLVARWEDNRALFKLVRH